MSLDGISLLEAPTGFSFTAGTATVFETDGTPVATGIHVADTTEADYRLRQHITFKNRNPQQQPDGTFSKGKREVVFTIPKELADGSIAYNVARVQMEVHPESTATELSTLRYFAAQVVLDAETDNFYVMGSTK